MLSRTQSRRRFLQSSAALAGLGLFTGCDILPSQLRQPAKVPRIGYLSQGPTTPTPLFIDDLRQGLAEHGYVEGQNIAIDVRFSEGRDERLPDLVAELVSLNVAAILAASPTSVRAAQAS
jgi:putative tryptophan/tyrosine transport system substrate-binding protein